MFAPSTLDVMLIEVILMRAKLSALNIRAECTEMTKNIHRDIVFKFQYRKSVSFNIDSLFTS